MNTLDLGRASQDRELRDDELGAVSGGNEGYPGLPLGSNINVFGLSLWDTSAPPAIYRDRENAFNAGNPPPPRPRWQDGSRNLMPLCVRGSGSA